MKGKLSKGILAAMLAAATVMSGCSAGSSSSSSTSGSSDTKAKSAKLKIMWWGAQDRHDATLKALDLYTKNNPEITFTPEYLSWDGYWSKLTVLAASKSMPDVLQMDAAYIQDYVQKKQLADLSKVSLKGIVDQKIIENTKIQGKTYGIPLGLNGQGYAYNKVDLAAAGITLPKAGWSWDDYFAFAEEGRSKLPKGKYAIGDYTNIWDSYQYYQTSYGKGPMFKDGTKFNLDKDLWFTYQKKYEDYRKRGVVPSASESLSYKENDAKGDPMASGAVMTRGATVGSVSALASLMPGKVAVVNSPNGPSGGGWVQSTIFLCAGNNSENIPQVSKFVTWFISDTEAGKILGTTRGIPVSNEVYKTVEPNLPAGQLLGKQLLDVALPKALPFYPAPPGWSDFVAAYKAEMEAVMFGKDTIEKAYDKIVKLGKETEANLK